MQTSICQGKALFQIQGRSGRSVRPSLRCERRQRDPSLRAVAVDDFVAEASELGMSFTPLRDDFGAQVSGIDLGSGISDAEGALIKKALDRFLLLRFREQTLEPADEAKLLSFLPHDKEKLKTAKSFFPNTIPGYPYLAVTTLNMELKDHYGINIPKWIDVQPFFQTRPVWHMDGSQIPSPFKYSYMYMKRAPKKADTIFASTTKAYSMLSEEQKEIANKLRLNLYSVEAIFKMYRSPDVKVTERGIRLEDPKLAEEVLRGDSPSTPLTDYRPPLVIEDPETGVRSLFVSPYKLHSFEGMTMEESHALVEEFLLPVTADPWPAGWQPGDIILWNNHQLIHAGPPPSTYDEPRLFHQVFWGGEELQPVQEEKA